MHRHSRRAVAVATAAGTPETRADVTANGKRLSKTEAPKGKPDKIQKTPGVGCITPPTVRIAAPNGDTYFCGFDSQEKFDTFTVINANNSPQKWIWSVEGYAFMLYNTSLAMDVDAAGAD